MALPNLKIERSNYYKQVLRVQKSNMFGFWRANEDGPSLNCGDWSPQFNNAAFSAATMMAQGRGPDGHPCPLFGTGVVLNLYSAGLAADTTMAEVSGIVWAQGNPGHMAGTTAGYILALITDANNNLIISKNTTAYQVAFDYQANNTDEQTTKTLDATVANDWHCYGFSVSDTDDYAKFYVDGVLEGTDTGIGTWSGALAEDTTVVGSSAAGTPADTFDGYISLIALWNTPLSDSEHKLLGTMLGS